jgi:energy-converting hydrogenase Eha subunit C
MAIDKDKLLENPLVIIAIGIAAAAVIAGLGWGLGQLLKFLCIGIGIAASIIAGTTAVGTVIASWVIPATATGLGAAGIFVTATVLFNVTVKVKKKPYEWLVPLLGVFSGFLINLSKEYYFDVPIAKIIFATISALLVVVGGVLFKKKRISYKVIALFLFFAPPLTILLSDILFQGKDTLLIALQSVHWSTWVSVIGLTAIAIMIMVLADKDTSKD